MWYWIRGLSLIKAEFEEVRNIKITIEYDGTAYSGWQRQPSRLTIQEAIESRLKEITGERIVIHGSGRTDSGVHAEAQVASFQTQSEIGAAQIQKGLNSILPKDIVIINSEDVPEDFHAQFSAKSKVYVYKIINRSFGSALLKNRVWHVPYDLNFANMIEASEELLGEHDFSAFAQADAEVKSKIRTVLNNEFTKKDDLIEFEIESSGFLKRMVRLIVGTLVQVGKERLSPKEFAGILRSGEKNKFVIAAPPQGLYLKEVKY